MLVSRTGTMPPESMEIPRSRGKLESSGSPRHHPYTRPMGDGSETVLASVDAPDIIVLTLAMTVAAAIAYLVYRSMEVPRLRLSPTPQGERATVRDAVLYAVTIPLIVVAWYAFMFCILLFAQNGLDAWSLVAIPAALIMSARMLAHVDSTLSREVSKFVPLALLTLIIVSGRVRDTDALSTIVNDVDQMQVTWPAVVLVLVFDYVVTATWYWGWVRWLRPRREARRGKQPIEHVQS